MLSEVVMGMQFRFFRQHLKAAPAFRISLPSTFTVPVCRLLKDTGMHYFSRLFLWTMWVLQRCDLEQPLVFLHFLLTKHLAYDNTCGDCSFKLDVFLDVFIKWCQTLPVNHWIEQAINETSKQQYRHQAYSNFWLEFRKTLVLRFSLYLNI